MQVMPMPLSICQKIERLCRNFLWGSDESHRKIHLIKWEQLCRPKDEGGMGIRKLKLMNEAFLLKLLWQLRERQKVLWARILCKRYNINTTRRLESIQRSGASNLWTAVSRLWPVVASATRCVIGDGMSVNFSKDKWLGDRTLAKITCRVAHPALDKVVVKDFLSPNGHWDHDKLCHCLPQEVFTIASAYDYWRQSSSSTDVKPSGIWQGAWKWQGPQRVRTFLFQCLHGKLMTNRERLCRKLTTEALCPLCKMEYETTIHVLWDYMMTTSLWVRIIPQREQDKFFTSPLREWLVSLNTDGAYRKSSDEAAVGGVIHNEAGEWRIDFVAKLSKCSAYRAELWGMLFGLRLAWESRTNERYNWCTSTVRVTW
ncbi:Ribonuclease H protein [Theobroma cacao]|uniref:Ribonuclease H protein n=1 Tax=Theobroma cacao TaxID=3641 RepID=A0A061FTP4_THECC|nr:Ribonuclease H protein [Theobroma cacao]